MAHCFEVKMHRGAPALFVDGEPTTGLMYLPGSDGDSWRDGLREMMKTGVRVLNSWMPRLLTEGGRGDEFDFAAIDLHFHGLLEVFPDALLLPRIACGTVPGSWLRENPEELVLYHDGTTAPSGGYSKVVWPSRSSAKWRERAGALFRELMEHVERSDYADSMLGYLLSHGQGIEWFNPCPYEPWFGDYSKPSLASFRRWLSEKYGSTGELRKAWRKDCVALETAEIPDIAHRLACGKGCFQRIRDPEREQDVVDWYTFYALENVDAITFFARLVKDVTERRRLVGAFYGYVLTHSWCPGTLLESGHLALREYLACPDVDFVSTVTSYTHRARGSGVSVFPSVVQSVHLAGKLYIDENDMRTHLLPPEQQNFGTHRQEDTIEVQRRELGAVFSEGVAHWWCGDWYNDPPTMSALVQLGSIGQRLLDFDRSSGAEIAFVGDTDGLLWTDLYAGVVWSFVEGQNIELSRLGAPADHLFPQDLRPDRPYKLYIFPCSYSISSAERDRILKLVKEQQSTVIWMYAAGYVTDGRCDVADMSVVTGFDIIRRGYHLTGLARTTGAGTCELSRKVEFGIPFWFAPFFEVEAEPGEIIGLSEDTGEPVLARREMPGGWTSVYSSVGPLRSPILRAIAREAGVHIYVDTDEFFNANNRVCVLHARDAGEKQIRLPSPGDVYDLLKDRELGTGVSSVTVPLEAGETGIYFFGSKREWEGR